MLRYLWLFALLCGAASPLLAQSSTYHPFPKDSASWGMANCSTTFFTSSGSSTHCSPFEYQLRGTDTIQQQVYSILYKDTTRIGAIREDSNRCIWFYPPSSPPYTDRVALAVPDSTEILLYDFGLQVGDTLVQFHTVGHFFAPDSSINVVEAEDSILMLDGSYRRCLQIHMHYLNNYQMPTDARTFWVEGIGAITPNVRSNLTGRPSFLYDEHEHNGILGSIGGYSYTLPRVLYEQPMYCVQHKDSFLLGYNGQHTCIPIVNSIATPPLNSNPTITIAPNPFSHQTTLTLPQTYPALRLEVYDLTGRLLHTQLGSGSSLTLKRNQLAAGLYLYRVSAKTQLLGMGKVVVE